MSRVLLDEPYRFEFFQAVRLFERMFPDRQPVGRNAGSPGREVVRFRTPATLVFPPSEVSEGGRRKAAAEDGRDPLEMTVTFMGLTGPLGVLPHHYTEMVAERARYKDTAIWEFLDLFNHRAISLFYRAWEKFRFPVAYERREQDRFTAYLFDLVGMGTKGLRGRLGMPDAGLLLYGGLVAQRPHSANTVGAVVGGVLGAPARVQQFVGQWLDLDDDSVTKLGRSNSRLGVSTVVGSRVWDDQSKFRVCFGPLTLEKFVALTPSGEDFLPASRLTRLLAGAEFDFDIQLTLKRDEVPGCRLAPPTGEGPRLGWTTWLKTREFAGDDSQVVLSVKE